MDSAMNQDNNTDNYHTEVSCTAFTACDERPLVDLNDFNIVMAIMSVPLVLITVAGVVTNTLSALVFARQGVLSDSTTVSLFMLTVVDIFSCLFLIPQCLCFYLVNYTQDMGLRNCYTFSTISASYTHVLCYQISCWITMYISVQRALCILFPFKVKSLISTKITFAATLLIVGSELLFHIPFFIYSQVLWSNNNTIATIAQNDEAHLLYRINNTVESTFANNAVLLIVVAATVAMVIRLKTASIWRANMLQKSANLVERCESQLNDTTRISAYNKQKMTTRDREVVKMVLCVTIVFLTCLSLGQLPCFAMYMVSGFSLDGSNHNLFHLLYTFTFFLDSINASLNFFFYLKMSSKFRKIFRGLFL